MLCEHSRGSVQTHIKIYISLEKKEMCASLIKGSNHLQKSSYFLDALSIESADIHHANDIMLYRIVLNSFECETVLHLSLFHLTL